MLSRDSATIILIKIFYNANCKRFNWFLCIPILKDAINDKIKFLAVILNLYVFNEEYRSDLIYLVSYFKCRNQISPSIKIKLYKHEGNRTLDFQNRNLMLYPLSYML